MGSSRQSRLCADGCAKDPEGWYYSHASDYSQVIQRLARVRTCVLTGSLDKAAEVLEKSYVFAVLSIRSDRDVHERAFTDWCTGTSLREASEIVNYPNQKADWIERTQARVDWENLVLAIRAHVRNGRKRDLLAIHEHLTGVRARKWAFTLAMAGVWEVACIDSNVGKVLEIGVKDEFNSVEEYVNACEALRTHVDAPVPLFIRQWVMYDFMRGEHARHMAYFRELPISQLGIRANGGT